MIMYTPEEYLKTKTLRLPQNDMYSGYLIPYSYLVSMLEEYADLKNKHKITKNRA